jgi:hypothetical protein
VLEETFGWHTWKAKVSAGADMFDIIEIIRRLAKSKNFFLDFDHLAPLHKEQIRRIEGLIFNPRFATQLTTRYVT